MVPIRYMLVLVMIRSAGDLERFQFTRGTAVPDGPGAEWKPLPTTSARRLCGTEKGP